MKIQYCSDLHLEFRMNQEFIKEKPIQIAGDILLLAGDIVLFKLMKDHGDFFDFCARNFEMTYWIPGNHEFYHSDISKIKPVLNEKIRENVFLLNNQSIIHKNVEMVFSTLWTHIPPQSEFRVQNNVSDFHVISNGNRKLSAEDVNGFHHNNLEFLQSIFAKPAVHPRIVVTHHVPTLMNYPAQFRNSPINCAFATELHDRIEKWNADYWIYGHSHCNTPEFTIGKTKLLCNQLGYVAHNEHSSFNSGAVIDL